MFKPLCDVLGCKSYQSSTCHDVGDEWEEPYGKSVCLKLTCKQTGNRFHHDIKYSKSIYMFISISIFYLT